MVSTGVADNGFLALLGFAGGIKWKGNGQIVYSAPRWSIGGRLRYFGSYWLSATHAVQPLQGSAKIAAQAYVDVFGSFKLTPKTEFRLGVNNVLDKSPPINSTSAYFYSQFGDPRRANFYVNLKRAF